MKFKDNHEDVNLLNLHQGHRGRLRERLLRNNFSDADDYLILEYILTLVVKRKDTNNLAHTLVSSFGSLAGVFDASIEDLEQIKGVTSTMAYFLHSIPYIFRNYKLSKAKPKAVITCAQDVFNYLGYCIYHLPEEEFYMILLDGGNRVICHKIISIGGNSQVAINGKEAVKFATKHKAKKVVLVHNHPTASCVASDEDIETTKRLYMMFNIENIEVFDHLIVDSQQNFYSFAHEGFTARFEKECIQLFKTDTDK